MARENLKDFRLQKRMSQDHNDVKDYVFHQQEHEA